MEFGRTLNVAAVTIANKVAPFNFNLLLEKALLIDALVGLARRARRPEGPLYGWIKLGLEQYFDPDLTSMRGSATRVNAITRSSELFVL